MYDNESIFLITGRGADDIREGGGPGSRPCHVAVAGVGVVMGPGSLLPADPYLIPGEQPVEVRDTTAPGAHRPRHRFFRRR